jgi:hypothetical protein
MSSLFFQLTFDNYTPTPAPSDVLPTSSRSKKTLVNSELGEDSSSKNLSQDLEELRQQLQYAKKQTLVMMEQSRKASEKEKIALQQAREAIAAKEAAVSEAEKATTRENSMLELMNEASADMSGMLFKLELLLSFCYIFFEFLVLSPNRFLSRRCC